MTIGPITLLASVLDAFSEAGMKPPVAILLKDPEQGRILKAAIRNDEKLWWQVQAESYRPVLHPDGSVWMEIKIWDVSVRWPAQQHAMEGGGYRWE